MTLLLPLLFSLVSHATTPPGLDLAQFQSLTAKAILKGEVIRGDYDLHTLSRITPNDPTQARDAEYFSAVGVTDNDGRFSAFQVSVVSEHWAKSEDGNWDIDQRIWGSALDGELQQVYHMRLRESANGSVLSDDVVPAGTPAEELALWEAKVAEWEK